MGDIHDISEALGSLKADMKSTREDNKLILKSMEDLKRDNTRNNIEIKALKANAAEDKEVLYSLASDRTKVYGIMIGLGAIIGLFSDKISKFIKGLFV